MTTWTPENLAVLIQKMPRMTNKLTDNQASWWAYSHILLSGSKVFYYDKHDQEWIAIDLGFYTNISPCLLSHKIYKVLMTYLKLCKKYKDSVLVEDDGVNLILKNLSNGHKLTLKALFDPDDISIMLNLLNKKGGYDNDYS